MENRPRTSPAIRLAIPHPGRVRRVELVLVGRRRPPGRRRLAHGLDEALHGGAALLWGSWGAACGAAATISSWASPTALVSRNSSRGLPSCGALRSPRCATSCSRSACLRGPRARTLDHEAQKAGRFLCRAALDDLVASLHAALAVLGKTAIKHSGLCAVGIYAAHTASRQSRLPRTLHNNQKRSIH